MAAQKPFSDKPSSQALSRFHPGLTSELPTNQESTDSHSETAIRPRKGAGPALDSLVPHGGRISVRFRFPA